MQISDPIPTSMLRILAVVDDDVSDIDVVAAELSPGSYTISIQLSRYSISGVPHNIVFYAVNDVGFVSNGALI
jgi:hypothetical protein